MSRRVNVDSYKRKDGTKVKAHSRGKPGKRKKSNSTLFFPPKYIYYSEIITFEDVHSAEEAVVIMEKEFNEAKTEKKMRRVASVVQLAENRARESAKRENLSSENRKKLNDIADVYGKSADKIWNEYHKYKNG